MSYLTYSYKLDQLFKACLLKKDKSCGINLEELLRKVYLRDLRVEPFA